MTRAERIWQRIDNAMKLLLNILMIGALFTGRIDYAILFTSQLCLLYILDGRAS
jgi:hypothetical protein